MAAQQAPPSLGFSRQERCSGLPFPSPMHESEKCKGSCSVVSDPQRPHGLQPTRLLRPWELPGKSTGVGCHFLLWPLLPSKCRKSDSTGTEYRNQGVNHMILINAGNVWECQHSIENSKILHKNLDLKQKNWVTMQFCKPGVGILQTSNEILITMTYSFWMRPTLIILV